ARLDVEDVAVLVARLSARRGAIIDPADRVVGALDDTVVLRARLERAQPAEADVDAEIDRDLAHGIAEILEAEIRIATCIVHPDAAAAHADHLVEREIPEVTAVGKVNVVALIRRQTKHFGDERLDGVRRPLVSVAAPARRTGIAEPPSEPHIEEREQQRDE